MAFALEASHTSSDMKENGRSTHRPRITYHYKCKLRGLHVYYYNWEFRPHDPPVACACDALCSYSHHEL